MFAGTHSDINSLKSGIICLIGQPTSQKDRAAKVKDGTIFGTIFWGLSKMIDTYSYILCNISPA
jgi:hypothetical protein